MRNIYTKKMSVLRGHPPLTRAPAEMREEVESGESVDSAIQRLNFVTE